MNKLDRLIEYISPEKALKRQAARKANEQLREPKNSGYGNYGASRSKKSMKGWIAPGGSATEDIQDNLVTLRNRSRDLYSGVPIATSALKTYRTNVVGSGLTPKPVIDAEFLGLSEEQAEETQVQITREFNLWANSKDCDAERLSNFWILQQLAYLSWLQCGDAFVVLQEKQRPGSPYSLAIQLIEADRVCTPGTTGVEIEPDDKIIGGVEVDDSGEVIAYYICNRHPQSYRSTKEMKWTRVPVVGSASGRRNILHLMIPERIGQRRGVPMLAPVIESLKQIGRYTDAELDAAVISSYVTWTITKEDNSSETPLGEISDDDMFYVDKGDKHTSEMAPGALIDLPAGESMEAITPGRPNTSFDGFVTSIARQIGAALELPYEVLMKEFTSSYSASRGALLEAWKSFDMWRDWMVDKFCQPIYEEWLSEAVAKGRVNAPGYFTDPAIRAAYSHAQWYGPTQGQLDPTSEVEAAELRVQSGFSTRAKESMELTGTDFKDNVRTAKRESELMKNAGLKAETDTAEETAIETERERDEEENGKTDTER